MHLGLHNLAVLTLPKQLHDARAVQKLEWQPFGKLAHIHGGLTRAAFARCNEGSVQRACFAIDLGTHQRELSAPAGPTRASLQPPCHLAGSGGGW